MCDVQNLKPCKGFLLYFDIFPARDVSYYWRRLLRGTVLSLLILSKTMTSQEGRGTMFRSLLRLLLIASTVFLLSSHPAFSLDGNGWRKLPENERAFYIIGVLDAWGNFDDLKTPPPPNLSPIVSCLRDQQIPYSQAVTIVEKYMTDNPARWQYGMTSSVWAALNPVCKRG